MRRLLNERQASERLGLSYRTLQQWRVRGTGPAFLKLGHAVRYDADILDDWLSNQVHSSTSA